MTKEKALKYLRILWKITGTAGIFLMPLISYVLFEYVTGNLSYIPPFMAALNVGWIFILYILFFIISGTTRITIPLVSIALLILSLSETFVVAFRDRPILIWDVLALGTALTVSGNYSFVFSEAMKQAAGLILLLNLLLWFSPIRLKGWKIRLGTAAAGAGLIAGFVFFFFHSLVPGRMLTINMWEVASTYQEYGYILSTAVSLQYVVKRPPAGYSQARVREIYREAKDLEPFSGHEPEKKEMIQPVNILAIMNESLSDLRVAGDFSANMDYLPFLNSLTENTVRGNLCVPVFGSMTSNTEFEFLTGDSVAMLPSNSIAYQFNVQPGALSLVSTLKEQGYYSVAMHPYPAQNWNRDRVYKNMGFDEFLDEEYYAGGHQFRNYISDRADFERLVEMVQKKDDPEDKLFIFNVTMQNHGGYEGSYDNFEQKVWLTGQYKDKYPKTDQYLSLMKESDDAFRYLIEAFSQSDEPTMIIMFGDHQPSVEDEFFDEIAGMPSSEVSAEDHLMWYETPFVIWTNYEQPSYDTGNLGAIYLSSYVLKLSNLEMTPYNRFLLNMSEALPVVHFLGCYDREGIYYGWEEAESASSPYHKLLLDYESLVYNHSLDQKTVREMFSLN